MCNQMSFCVESMMSYHTAIASAIMTSMPSISSWNYERLSEGIINVADTFRNYNEFVCYLNLITSLLLHRIVDFTQRK